MKFALVILKLFYNIFNVEQQIRYYKMKMKNWTKIFYYMNKKLVNFKKKLII